MTFDTQASAAGPPVEDRLAVLEQAVADLRQQLNEIAEESITPAELAVVPGFDVLRPIPIVVEESADDAAARWVEAALYGLGRSEGEAIESLRDVISEVWHDLESTADSGLSRHTRTMRAVLRCYLKPAA